VLFGTRKHSFFDQSNSQPHQVRKVYREDFDSDFADRGLADKLGTVPFEVIRPTLPSWVEQRDVLLACPIEAGDVGPFVRVAPFARKRKILSRSRPAMLLGDDVVDLKGQACRCRWELTIFTATVGSFPDQLHEGAVYASTQVERPALFNERRAFDWISSSRKPTCS
jgi:hypothetical protein